MMRQAFAMILLIWLPSVALGLDGETMETAIPIPSLPFTDQRNSCEYQDDYQNPDCDHHGQGSPDIVYRYVPTENMSVVLSLCYSHPGFNTVLLVYVDGPDSLLACTWLSCYAGEDHGLFRWLYLHPGSTYYIVVDGLSPGGCGNCVFEMSGCAVPCPPGALDEGEPLGYDGYVDDYNSGCWGSGWVDVGAQAGDCADVCGMVSSWRTNGVLEWDYDWYRMIAVGGTVRTVVESDFMVGISYYRTDCSGELVDSGFDSGNCYSETSIGWDFAPGEEVWLAVDEGQPYPEGRYWLHICGIANLPTPVLPENWGRIKHRYRSGVPPGE